MPVVRVIYNEAPRLALVPKGVQLWSYDHGDFVPCTEWQLIAIDDSGDSFSSVSWHRGGIPRPFAPGKTRRCSRPIEDLAARSLALSRRSLRGGGGDDAMGRAGLGTNFDASVCVPAGELWDFIRPSSGGGGLLWPKRKKRRRSCDIESASGRTRTISNLQSLQAGDAVVVPWSPAMDRNRQFDPPLSTLDDDEAIQSNSYLRRHLPDAARRLASGGRWFSATVVRVSDLCGRAGHTHTPTVLLRFQDGNRKCVPRYLAVPIPEGGPLTLVRWSKTRHSGWMSQSARDLVRTVLLCQARLARSRRGRDDDGGCTATKTASVRFPRPTATLADIGELLVEEVLPYAIPNRWMGLTNL